MAPIRTIVMGMIFFVSLAGCFGEYVGSSFNENGDACETHEYKNGTQVTYCDSHNQNPPYRR